MQPMVFPQIIRIKIIPPQKSPRTLERPRIIRLLLEALHYRLTILQAGAGYGKSTALASLTDQGYPLIWYQVTEEDSDSAVFLLHLCHATQYAFPEIRNLPLSTLEAWDGSRGALPSKDIMDQYVNAIFVGINSPTLLILDDVHRMAEGSDVPILIDRLVYNAPHNVHIILSTRPVLKIPNLNRYHLRGDVLTIDQKAMAFTPEEINQLFSQYFDYEVTNAEVDQLYAATEGWAITLQTIWQSLRAGAAVSIEDAISRQVTSLEGLYEVLTQEILAKQPEDVRQFLRITATLKVMTPLACDFLRSSNDSEAILSYLRRQELFVVDLGDEGLRYHHIFHQFLHSGVEDKQRRAWHRRAAAFFQGKTELDNAVYHLLQAEDENAAADLLSTYGGDLLAKGRLDTLMNYLHALTPETLIEYPLLLILLGDLARLHSRFQEALGWYHQAEGILRDRGLFGGVARALRGQARVYLDTVNPSRAEELLQQALRISDGIDDRQAQAGLYELLAENKLNAGKPQEAVALRKKADLLRREGPSDSQLLIRVLLRTGKLEQARNELESYAESERQQPVKMPRAHRETQLLLSIVYAFLGEADKAYRTAMEGTQRGIELDSPFVTAVGYMRQGHALMLLAGKEGYEQARQQFIKAIEFSQVLAIPRLRVEAGWGLCRVFGFQGDLSKALSETEEAVRIANQSGDEWIASISRLTMGASLILSARYESATHWLDQAIRGFQECSDPFGSTVARLWQCIGWYRSDEYDRLAEIFQIVLKDCSFQGYDFLFTRPTLLGPPDERVLVPLLVLARDRGWHSSYANRLLERLNLSNLISHPGYQLRIQTLGSFQVYLGKQLILPKGWRREKSRHLFQLLLSHRDAPLDREQIFEFLWPGLDPDSAQRNFKVTLNTLYQVLEPNRLPGSESAYILREGSIYSLRPGADLWLDSEEFEHACNLAGDLLKDNPHQAILEYERAIGFYLGEFLPEARYDTWAAVERERLAVMFLHAADLLVDLYFNNHRFDEVISVSQNILLYDNCWERAYRYLMLAYDRLGDHGQVGRVYQRCIQILRCELDIGPAPETIALFKRLTQGDE
jgi:LuxR family transcriptional regulator, maltose regulon positive regulatory protein